ncbi:hypothetical protein DENSPDRAFT_930574 [Dentipellis sp. KUC8613]|nr:hypothetical protein DENSPDRAFT_930574 [Dentipellis sp. KUC8613]
MATHEQALRDHLARLKAQLAADRAQAAADAALQRDRSARAALDRHHRLVAQLTGVASLVAGQSNDISSCTEQIHREASLTDQRRTEQDAKLDSLQAMLAQVREGQEAARVRAEQHTKPDVDTMLQEIRKYNAEQSEILASLASQLQEDARRRHEELQTYLLAGASARESMSFSISDES